MKNILPKEKRLEVAEKIAFAYPIWFIEIFCAFEEDPIILEQFQRDILLDIDSPFLIVNKSRQSGGSMIFAYAEFYKAYTTHGLRTDVVSVTAKEALDKIKYVRDVYDTVPAHLKAPLSKDNAFSIGFHAGNKQSVINSLAPTSGVRGGRKSLLLDEFAWLIPKRQEELYTAAAPALLNSKEGRALTMRIVSTPNGDSNLFAQIAMNRENADGEQQYGEWKRHTFIWLDCRRHFPDQATYEKAQHAWYTEADQNLREMDGIIKLYGNDIIKGIRASMAREDFEQEFCGSFLSYKDAFFTSELVTRQAKPNLTEEELRKLDVEGAMTKEEAGFRYWDHVRPNDGKGGEVVMGLDFGESTPDKDKTCIQVIQKDPKTDKWLQRWSLVLDGQEFGDFTYQGKIIADAVRRFRPNKIVLDHTGIGRPISDILRKEVPEAPRFDEITITNANKDEMITNLRYQLEADKLWIQADDKGLQRELRNMQRTVSPQGTVRYGAEPHDDRVLALALAMKGTHYTPFMIYRL